MQIGIYGGSFNPVHYGHVGLAKWVAEHTDLDEVWMMVSPNNPLKDSRELADEQGRLEGVRKAIEGINRQRHSRDVPGGAPPPSPLPVPTSRDKRSGAGEYACVPGNARVVACDFEFRLPRPSYTANTLRALAAAYPQHTFSLIIGEDNLRILPRWREWEYIVSHYRIFVYPRRETGSEERSVVSGQWPGNAQIIMLEGAPYFDISSTEIRAKASANDR
ncbi:MAG: nicotinate-nicotinamide nucleotide adenylyltransferase [Paludibacteraceae bacterium]